MGTPAHTVLRVQQVLTQDGMIPTPHPSCSPDLIQSNFSLFPQGKKSSKGKHFASVEEVKQKTVEALKGLKIDEFENCFE